MPKKPAHQNKQLCGHPKPDGAPCARTAGWGTPHLGSGACRSHGGNGGAPEGNQNAVGHGAPLGNQNARTHGLFSKALGATGQAALAAISALPADEAARGTADWIIAKVIEACEVRDDINELHPLLVEFLSQAVAEKRLDAKGVEWFLARFAGPDLVAIGKFLGPLKGLLEVKKAKEGDPAGSAIEALTAAIKGSQARRDAEAGER